MKFETSDGTVSLGSLLFGIGCACAASQRNPHKILAGQLRFMTVSGPILGAGDSWFVNLARESRIFSDGSQDR
jgi:hypothetical protein